MKNRRSYAPPMLSGLQVAGGCLSALLVIGLGIAILILIVTNEADSEPRMAPPRQIASATSPDGRYACVVIANELAEDEPAGGGYWYELVLLDAATHHRLPGNAFKLPTDSSQVRAWEIEWKNDSFYVRAPHFDSSLILRGTIDATGQHWNCFFITQTQEAMAAKPPVEPPPDSPSVTPAPESPAPSSQ